MKITTLFGLMFLVPALLLNAVEEVVTVAGGTNKTIELKVLEKGEIYAITVKPAPGWHFVGETHVEGEGWIKNPLDPRCAVLIKDDNFNLSSTFPVHLWGLITKEGGEGGKEGEIPRYDVYADANYFHINPKKATVCVGGVKDATFKAEAGPDPANSTWEIIPIRGSAPALKPAKDVTNTSSITIGNGSNSHYALAGITPGKYLVKATSRDGGHKDEAELLVVKVKIHADQSTPWLVIEDEYSPGAGPDGENGPIQTAENQAIIVYDILPVDLELPSITISVGEYKLTNTTIKLGENQIYSLDTKDGKLRFEGDDKWYPRYGRMFPAGDHKVVLKLDTEDFECSSEMLMTVRPLLANLGFTPDIAKGEKLCPYSNKFNWVDGEHGFGLLFMYDLLDDLMHPYFRIHVAGGDVGKYKDLITSDIDCAKGIGLMGKWEGYDDKNHEYFRSRGVYLYPSALQPDYKAPERVVKEGVDYCITMKMTNAKDKNQKQSFVIPFEVKYQYE